MKNIVLTGLLFGASLTPAFATCSTRDLVAELQTSSPETYQSLVNEADQFANSEGVFWEVSHESLPHKSYVFGTLHKADPRIMTLPKNVEAALNSVDVLAVEIEDADNPSAVGAVIGKNPQLMLQPQGETLADDLTPEAVSGIDSYLNSMGMDFDMINPLQPWMGASMLAFTPCDMEWGGPSAQVLDAKLVSMAKAADIPVVSLETIEEQFLAISSIDQEMFIRSMEDAARLYQDGMYEALVQSMNQLYLSEQIGLIMPLQIHFSAQYEGQKEDLAQFQEALLNVRNEGMVAEAAALMDEQSTFVAVGALHLIGETGLIEGLRNDGFAVTRVPLER